MLISENNVIVDYFLYYSFSLVRRPIENSVKYILWVKICTSRSFVTNIISFQALGFPVQEKVCIFRSLQTI